MPDFPMRRLAGVMLLALGIALGGCEDDPVVPDPEPEVATMRLTIGAQTIDIDDTGVVTGGPIAMSANTAISVQWLKANGTPETIVTAAEFQLDVTTDNASVVTFSRSTAFTGNLVKAAAGSTILRFSLFHIIEGHPDFGPFPVNVTVS